MSHTRSVLFLIIVVLTITAPPARAGGWWNSVEFPETVAPGETLEIETQDLWFPTIAQAERSREEQGYYAYLIAGLDEKMVEEAMGEDFDPAWWRLGDARVYEAGTVTAAGGNSNLVDATIHLDIPEVEPGSYALMLCDLGCTEPMGSVVPSHVTVAADEELAGLTREIESLRSRLVTLRVNLRSDLRRGLAQGGRDVRAVDIDLASVEERVTRQSAHFEESLDELGERVEALEKADDLMGAAWIGLGGLLVGLLVLKRKRTAVYGGPSKSLEREAITS